MKEENMFMFYLLSFTWGILWTLIGFITLLFVFIIYHREIEIYTVRGRIIVNFDKKNFGGASLGIVILVSSDSTSLVRHEIGHSIQNTYMGPLFIFLVAIPSGIRYQLFDWLDNRHYKKTGLRLDYDRVWFEGQATRLGNKHRQLWNGGYEWVDY